MAITSATNRELVYQALQKAQIAVSAISAYTLTGNPSLVAGADAAMSAQATAMAALGYGGGATGPVGPVVNSLTNTTASGQTLALTPPTGNVTGYVVTSYNAATGAVVPSAYDDSASATSSTRIIKGLPAGGTYKHVVAAVIDGVQSTGSTVSPALAVPVHATARVKTNQVVSYYNPALTAADNISTSATFHMQRTLLGTPATHSKVAIWLLNASTVQDSTGLISVSFSPIAGGKVAVGSPITAANQDTLNNTGTWSTPASFTVPKSTAASGRGDGGHGMLNVLELVKATLSPVARTDFAAGNMIMNIRVSFAVGASYTFCNLMPNNGAPGASQDFAMAYEDPSKSLVGGRLLRSYRQTGVDGVTTITAMTANGATFVPNIALACFHVQTFTSAIASQVAVLGDSRESFAKSTYRAGAGVHFMAAAAASTDAAPVELALMAGDGFGPTIWAERSAAMIGLFTGTPMLIIPINSINGWGSGAIPQSNYDSNKATVDAIVTAWQSKAGGCRLVRSTVQGVSPEAASYQWGTTDATIRRANNRTVEDASTATIPVIPVGSLTEGAQAANGMYDQTDFSGNSWVEFGSGDGTKAHFTYFLAKSLLPFYIPFYNS